MHYQALLISKFKKQGEKLAALEKENLALKVELGKLKSDTAIETKKIKGFFKRIFGNL